VGIFLFYERKKLVREGPLFLYKTKIGLKIIDSIAKKYPKFLRIASYVIVISGYLLMIAMIALVVLMISSFLDPEFVQRVKIPPLMPLIPYLPELFKVDWLPPFYFTYWIVILGVLAITHEFAHGIFLRRYGIKIKSTGFGFFPFLFPVFLAAFVEQDEKSMNKSKSFHQMAVLSAGTFANLITAGLFFIITAIFFTLSFAPAGIQFNSYSYSIINTNTIESINGINTNNLNYQGIIDLINETGFNEIKTSNGNYIATKDFIIKQKTTSGKIVLYNDSPAIRAGIEGAIIKIDNQKITNWDELGNILSEKSPGDKITITSLIDEKEINYEIILGENPEKTGKSWLGIGYSETKREGIAGKIISSLSSFKKEHIYYESKFEAGSFIYNLLWWLVLISFSVALVNMLPMGIFDGGRFFYLTIFGITKSEKAAKNWFKWITYFFLFLLAVLMFFWIWSFLV